MIVIRIHISPWDLGVKNGHFGENLCHTNHTCMTPRFHTNHTSITALRWIHWCGHQGRGSCQRAKFTARWARAVGEKHYRRRLTGGLEREGRGEGKKKSRGGETVPPPPHRRVVARRAR